MTDDSVDPRDGIAVGARKLLAVAAVADARAQLRLKAAADDFFLPDAARLDDRTRTALAELQCRLIDTIESELRDHAARLLAARGEPMLAAALEKHGEAVRPRLLRSGLLRDPELMGELLLRVWQDLLAALLPGRRADPERPDLINRLIQHADRAAAGAAMGVLIAESRRRGASEAGIAGIDLPIEQHHRLVWWVAAALREQVAPDTAHAIAALDRALSEAVARNLAGHDETGRVEAAAMRLAAALDIAPRELPDLLLEALDDRCIPLFIALIARGLGIDYRAAGEIVLDPAGERLWLALRALDLGRDVIAQIGYTLSQADPRRDLETFADLLDSITAVTGEEARAALAPLRLDPACRAALLALRVA